MYCSTCGFAVANGLSYCKQCGASLVAGTNTFIVPDAPAPPASRALPWLIAFSIGLTALVGLGGLTLIFVMVRELAHMNFPVKSITAFALFSMLTTFGTTHLIVRQLSRLIDAYQPTSLRAPTSKSLHDMPRATPTPIGAFREPASSITEHTTRTFEPSQKEPRIS